MEESFIDYCLIPVKENSRNELEEGATKATKGILRLSEVNKVSSNLKNEEINNHVKGGTSWWKGSLSESK